MSMQELTDDQLDGLFRKSAEEFDPPYDPAAWEAMRDRLDDRDRAAFWRRLLPWAIPALLLFLLTGGGWYAYQKSRPVGTQSAAKMVDKNRPTLAHNPKQRQQDEAARTTDNKLAGTVPVDNPASGSGKETQPVDVEKSASERVEPIEGLDKSAVRLSRNTDLNTTKRPVSTYRKKTGSANVSPVLRTTPTRPHRSNHLTATGSRRPERIRRERASLSNRSDTKARSVDKQNVGSTTTSESAYAIKPANSLTKRVAKNYVETASIDAPNAPANSEIVESSESLPVALPAIAELTIRPGQWPKLSGLMSREVTQPERTEPVSIVKAVPSRGFSIRFVVSPDLSAIGLHNFSRPGTNVGALAEYRMTSRWSVQAGIIKSTKVYKASMSEYTLPDYFLKSPVKPEGANGVCNMIDIPINVRYDFALRPRLDGKLPSRWFVSGGITSYVILQEDYTYNYADPTNPHIYANMRQWSGSSGGYGFSQLNLSAGYERALSKRLSWQVEPFMKAPLKGIGYLKINLLSTGAFFSIRYKL